MIHEDEFVSKLMDLGLTLIQAKAYLALCRLESADIRTISKTSYLARQDVYRVMPTLQKLGLAEQIISSPVKYRATPIKMGISMLLLNKTHEHSELQKKTLELLGHLNSFQAGDERILRQDEPEQQFVVTHEVTLLFKRLIKGTQATKTSIDSIGTWESFASVVSKGFEDFQEALDRGVRIRSITEKPENERVPRYLKNLRKNALYEVRFIPSPAPVTMSILDKKEVNIAISTPNSKDVASLWSNNPSILAISTNYFEELWHKASSKRRNRKRIEKAIIVS